MSYIFFLGFLLGLRHALDADHLATVATLASRARSMGETARTGVAWGAAHAVTLFAVCALVLSLDVGMPETLAAVF